MCGRAEKKGWRWMEVRGKRRWKGKGKVLRYQFSRAIAACRHEEKIAAHNSQNNASIIDSQVYDCHHTHTHTHIPIIIVIIIIIYSVT